MSPFVVKRAEFNFYKTVGFSLTSNVILGWFVYALFAENYIGHQFFNNLGYLFVPVLRPDFIIYFFVIPLMTSFWNILYQSTDQIKYIVKTYPIVYMMAPFFLDNFYFLLNHTPLGGIIEIQFIFISNPTVLTYVMLTIIYLIAGFIVMVYAERMWSMVAAIAFAIAEFSSLIVSSLLEPEIAKLSFAIASFIPTYGVFLGNQLRLWFISFENNATAYISCYLSLILGVLVSFIILRLKLGTNWWEKRPIDVTKNRLTRLIKVLD